jgi:ribA/ribD-fused uncharacterized protein
MMCEFQLPLDRASLIQRCAAGEAFKYLFFWGHEPKSNSTACFSQWFDCAFECEGHRFATAEHYMMYRKACLFGDEKIAKAILSASHPGEAKALGRQVSGFQQLKWEQRRLEIVVSGNMAKFSADERSRSVLLNSRQRILVEASPVDTIWGSGLEARHPKAAHATAWPGLNLLGFALMQVRTELAAIESMQ